MNQHRLGASIRELRTLKGWGVRELGRISGVSASTISRLEGANDKNTTLRSIEQIADALGVGVGELYDYTPAIEVCPTCGGTGWVKAKEQSS